MMLLFLTLLFFPLYISSAPLPYAEWAHHHMIWISNDRSNQDTVQWMYGNFTQYDIPFGSVLIDSCWASNFNTFIFNSTKFPSAHEMLSRFRSDNKHIILWMTSFINIDSPNFHYALMNGYLYNKTLHWWHGDGCLLDYYNPAAVAWWNSQIKALIDTVGPIHAFKADASDPYILKIDNRTEAWEKYRTAYYNNTFQILRKLVGPDALIMSRPVDGDKSYSPRDVVFMGWVGDEDGNYTGLETALRYMLESGSRGYVGFGSDIGGFRSDYKSSPKGRTKELLLRWTAVGAFSSFMENGGTGEHFPWNFDNETVDIYRSWVNTHNKLIPYLYLHGTQAAMQANASLMNPCDDSQAEHSQSYFLGPNIYVVPVKRDPAPGQTQQVWLPKSSTNQWINFFNTSQVHKSESFISEDTSTLDRIPSYVEQNSLMPMYDIEKSPSLKAYRFVLWGKASLDQQTTTLYTRDGQQWLLRFDREKKQFSIHFQQQFEANEKVDWIWKFCQYVNEQEICSSDWRQLKDNTAIHLDLVH